MIAIFSSILAGMFIGRLFLRKRPVNFIGRLITLIIWMLLLSLGLEVGSNPEVAGNLGTLGFRAFSISVAAMSGSAFFSWILWRCIRRGAAAEAHGISLEKGPAPAACTWSQRIGDLWNSLKGSLIIVGFFILGFLMGFQGVLKLNFQSFPLTRYVLYALLVSIGVTIGADEQFFSRIRRLNWRFMLLPLMTITGTLAGVSLLWMLARDYLLPDYLAVGSGFAYYSLSSIFITEFRGAELGTVALLSNVFREILSLLFIPLVSRFLGPLPAISMGGATTFDTTLPVILQSAGKEYLVVSAFHGCICDFSVPLLVTLFCSIV